MYCALELKRIRRIINVNNNNNNNSRKHAFWSEPMCAIIMPFGHNLSVRN